MNFSIHTGGDSALDQAKSKIEDEQAELGEIENKRLVIQALQDERTMTEQYASTRRAMCSASSTTTADRERLEREATRYESRVKQIDASLAWAEQDLAEFQATHPTPKWAR